MAKITRRAFLGRTIAATAAIGGVRCAADRGERPGEVSPRRTAVDLVALGRTGIRASRLGFGTGSDGGQIQRDLGKVGLAKLVRHAYDRGIRYFDTADAYQIHGILGEALRGLPREDLFIQTKIPKQAQDKVPETLDRFRKEMGTEYLDSVLIHAVQTTDWPEKLKAMREALSAAKEKKFIRAHGISCHGQPGLQASTACEWVDIALIRINPQARHIDGPTGEWAEPGDLPKSIEAIGKLHAARKGVIGMKIIGNGEFVDAADRESSIRYVMGLASVDAIVIGFKSPAEIDEAIGRMDAALGA